MVSKSTFLVVFLFLCEGLAFGQARYRETVNYDDALSNAQGQSQSVKSRSGVNVVFIDDIIIEENEDGEDEPERTINNGIDGNDGSKSGLFSRHLTRVAAASMAAFFSTLGTYPFDQLRTLHQYGADTSNYWLEPKRWLRGLSAQLMASGITSGIGMVMYDYFKDERGWSPLLAGAVGTMSANVVGTPLFVTRVQKSLAPIGQPYTWREHLRVVKAKPSIAYRGNAMNMIGLIPQSAYYETYERINGGLKDYIPGEPGTASEFLRHGLAAGSARVVVSGVSFPIETVRVLRQKDGMSYSDIVTKLYAEGGLMRFYAGYPWSTLRAVQGTALYFSVYHLLKKQMTD